MSHRNNAKRVKQQNVSAATLSPTQNGKGVVRNKIRKTGNNSFYLRPTAAAVGVVRKIRNLITMANPPTKNSNSSLVREVSAYYQQSYSEKSCSIMASLSLSFLWKKENFVTTFVL